MKKLSIFLFAVVTIAAQRQPDEKLTNNFLNATLVEDALNKAKSAVQGTGTANQIAYWTSTNTLGSLATNTYPSLVELSRLKGVTSNVQTQLNGKQSTLVSGTNIKTVNGQTLLGSGNITINASNDTTGSWLKIYTEVKRQLESLMSGPLIGRETELDSMILDYRKNNYLRVGK